MKKDEIKNRPEITTNKIERNLNKTENIKIERNDIMYKEKKSCIYIYIYIERERQTDRENGIVEETLSNQQFNKFITDTLL